MEVKGYEKQTMEAFGKTNEIMKIITDRYSPKIIVDNTDIDNGHKIIIKSHKNNNYRNQILNDL
jgi:hypothetical protein